MIRWPRLHNLLVAMMILSIILRLLFFFLFTDAVKNNARLYVGMTIRGKLYEERIRWGVLLKLRRDLEKRKCKNDECRSIVTRICSTCNSLRKEAADSLPRRFPREASHGSIRMDQYLSSERQPNVMPTHQEHWFLVSLFAVFSFW